MRLQPHQRSGRFNASCTSGLRFLGLDVHNPVFAVSSLTVIVFRHRGLMFFGVAQPVDHFLNPPLGVDPEDRGAVQPPSSTGAFIRGPCSQWSHSRSPSPPTISDCR